MYVTTVKYLSGYIKYIYELADEPKNSTIEFLFKKN